MPTNSIVHADLLTALMQVSEAAGDLIMRYYEGDSNARMKEDRSPVTDADIAANQYIVQRLRDLMPGVPVISEEAERQEVIDSSKPFFLVDPLDGTKSFIRKTGQFTVNIGLIEQREPVAGVIYVPVQQTGYAGMRGAGAIKWRKGSRPEAIATRCVSGEGADVVVSHSHRTPETDAFLATIRTRDVVSAASSLKFCVVAEGRADIYPRFGRTMEWDTAAGHAIVAAAGGRMVTPEGHPFLYAKPEFENGNFIVFGEEK